MKQRIDIAQWPRRDHFHFFGSFDEPFFGVTVQVDCTKAFAHAKEAGVPLFLYYLHCSLRAVNALEAFRYRIVDGEVWLHDAVHASATIDRPDGTFGFSYMDYHERFADFLPAAQAEINRVRQTSGLVPAVSGENVIHYSALPWLDFTAVQLARSYAFKDSCPKITFGKIVEKEGRRTMACSVHVHHGLADGYHVGEFAALFQELLDAAG